MLNNILRTPLFPMSAFVIIIVFLLLSITNTHVALLRLCLGILIAFTFLWLTLLKFHNTKNAKDKIKSYGIMPPEFRDMDEGQQWITYRACRNVYIYYCFALPLSAGIYFLFSHYKLTPLLCIGLLGIGQYLVYWLTTVQMLKRV